MYVNIEAPVMTVRCICKYLPVIKFLVIMPSDIRILFSVFNSNNLSATVLSKMFFFYSLFLLVEYKLYNMFVGK